eukprot:CAMPEP_0194377640 /NCGR_PEP_ID=MMETSP0174-20130528/32178_1 /TAXON_ID=216777 /ORGANISM="Proboscia alata, Strain PI-D3" /LENGTH=556 /DNA_ID=CAMNT_0039159139 /DNA_START=76 /DNA_END=1746 /DNA_ORIENTATION=+
MSAGTPAAPSVTGPVTIYNINTPSTTVPAATTKPWWKRTWASFLAAVTLLSGIIGGVVPFLDWGNTPAPAIDQGKEYIPVIDQGKGYGGENCEINDRCYSNKCDKTAGRCFCTSTNDDNEPNCLLDNQACLNNTYCVPLTLAPSTLTSAPAPSTIALVPVPSTIASTSAPSTIASTPAPSPKPSAAPTCSLSLEMGDNKLLASDASRESNFGSSVAMDGNTAVIGAYSDESAYIFDSNGSEWAEMTKLTTSDEFSFRFGCSVAIDEGTAIVGASGYKGAESVYGAAYIFSNSGINNWVFQKKLMASDDGDHPASVKDYFGGSVALDGNTVIIGARGGGNDVGAAYVFVRNESKWEFQERMVAHDTFFGNRFGTSVALDGDTAVIGADNAVYIFTRKGSKWTYIQKLDDSSNDKFGRHVALDTDIAVVGAIGSAIVYVRSGAEWALRQKLLAKDLGTSFEYSIASIVAIEGTTIVLHFPVYDVANSAYIYTRTGSGSKWTVAANLTANYLVDSDEFGSSVALSESTVMVGAPGLPEGDDSSQGSVYTMDHVACYPSF